VNRLWERLEAGPPKPFNQTHPLCLVQGHRKWSKVGFPPLHLAPVHGLAPKAPCSTQQHPQMAGLYHHTWHLHAIPSTRGVTAQGTQCVPQTFSTEMADKSVWECGSSEPGQPSAVVDTHSHAGLELWGRDDGDLPSGLAKPLLQAVLHQLQEAVARFPLVLEAEAAVANIVQVLQPLEEGYHHTTCIHIHVLPRALHASDSLAA